MGADNNVCLWQEGHLCWQLERKGLESRTKSINAARVRTKPSLCIGAFKVSEPYHEQRAHLLRQQHRKAEMRTKGISFGLLQAASAKLEDLSECAVYMCSWNNALGPMLRAIANRPLTDDRVEMR